MGIWRCKVSLRCGIRNNLRPLHLAASYLTPLGLTLPIQAIAANSPLGISGGRRIGSSMEKLPYQRTDYSVVVKNVRPLQNCGGGRFIEPGMLTGLSSLRSILNSVLGARRAL